MTKSTTPPAAALAPPKMKPTVETDAQRDAERASGASALEHLS